MLPVELFEGLNSCGAASCSLRWLHCFLDVHGDDAGGRETAFDLGGTKSRIVVGDLEEKESRRNFRVCSWTQFAPLIRPQVAREPIMPHRAASPQKIPPSAPGVEPYTTI